jgi:hypothetical protein
MVMDGMKDEIQKGEDGIYTLWETTHKMSLP